MYWLAQAQTVHYDDPDYMSGELWSHYPYNIVIWAPGSPAGLEERVRKALAGVDPDLLLYSVDPYSKILSADFQREDMIATLTTLFGVLGFGAGSGWVIRRAGLQRRAADRRNWRPDGAGRGSPASDHNGAGERLPAGGRRTCAWPSSRDCCRQADGDAVVRRGPLGSGDAGSRYVVPRRGSAGGVDDSRLARSGR